MKPEDQALLKSVSRSFYLSIRFLPATMREPVALGYLIARLTDTVADAPGIPEERRLELLEGLRHSIQESAPLPDFKGVGETIEKDGEKELVAHAAGVFDW